MLSEWLDILLKPEVIEDSASGVGQFNRRYGFRDKSQRVRFRILDRSLNLLKGDNDQDISVGRVFYWGDIDTHGLAILSSARVHFPQLNSILMDKATLMAHKHFWSTEPRQHLAQDLNNLDADESALFSDLKAQVAGNNVRIEQEFI